VIGFLGITGHYIDADWKLKDILVDFIELQGSHSGENLANAFVKCLQEKRILTKASNELVFDFYNKKKNLFVIC
jgi:hypothetical protein